MPITKKFKTTSAKRADQVVNQEAVVSSSLQFDYSKSTWIGIDTEFLSINPIQDKLCTIQISSEDPENSEQIRTEVLYVFKSEPDPNLVALMQNENVEKILHTFQADLPRIEGFIGAEVKGKIYDVAIAAKLTLTNLDGYSLENLTQFLIDPVFSKNKKVSIAEWDLDPDMWEEEQFEYAVKDVMYLGTIKERLNLIADRRGKLGLVNEAMKVIPTFSKLIKHGFDHRIYS